MSDTTPMISFEMVFIIIVVLSVMTVCLNEIQIKRN